MLTKNHIYASHTVPIQTIAVLHIITSSHRIDRIRADLRIVRLSIQNVPMDARHRMKRLLRIVNALFVRTALHSVGEDIQDLIANHIVEERLHFAIPSVVVVGHRVAIVLLSSSMPEIVQKNEARQNPARGEEHVEDLLVKEELGKRTNSRTYDDTKRGSHDWKR